MKTFLICHHDAPLDRIGLARFMNTFSELSGIVEIREDRERLRRRVRREMERVGRLRFAADVLPFRAYYSAVLARRDRAWEQNWLSMRARHLPEIDAVPVLKTANPNSDEARAFMERVAPDVCIARCKFLLKESVFSLPRHGTFVLHPGICPEYRNAHGCFWALANDDLDNVGATLLRIDRGVDTGPVYGYLRTQFDEVHDSHVVIQNKVVLDNLETVADLLRGIVAGTARPIPVDGRPSHVWGQPWLSKYVYWKRQARKRKSPTLVQSTEEAT